MVSTYAYKYIRINICYMLYAFFAASGDWLGDCQW